MKIRANKFAFIYAALPAAGGFIGASLAGDGTKNIFLAFSLFMVAICFVFALVLIKEIELNGERMVINRFLPTKERRIDNIRNVEISKRKIHVSTTDGKKIGLNSRYINKTDLKELNEYVLKHIH